MLGLAYRLFPGGTEPRGDRGGQSQPYPRRGDSGGGALTPAMGRSSWAITSRPPGVDHTGPNWTTLDRWTRVRRGRWRRQWAICLALLIAPIPGEGSGEEVGDAPRMFAGNGAGVRVVLAGPTVAKEAGRPSLPMGAQPATDFTLFPCRRRRRPPSCNGSAGELETILGPQHRFFSSTQTRKAR